MDSVVLKLADRGWAGGDGGGITAYRGCPPTLSDACSGRSVAARETQAPGNNKRKKPVSASPLRFPGLLEARCGSARGRRRAYRVSAVWNRSDNCGQRSGDNVSEPRSLCQLRERRKVHGATDGQAGRFPSHTPHAPPAAPPSPVGRPRPRRRNAFGTYAHGLWCEQRPLFCNEWEGKREGLAAARTVEEDVPQLVAGHLAEDR